MTVSFVQCKLYINKLGAIIMLEYLGIDDSFIAGSICTACLIGYVLLGYASVLLWQERRARRLRYERAASTDAGNRAAPYGADVR